MGRTVRFGETEFTLNLTGLHCFFSLKQKVTIPYSTIKSVFVDDFDAPRWMLRMPGTSISPLHIYEGSFKHADKWYFLSYESRQSLVIIELEGHNKYAYVIFSTRKSYRSGRRAAKTRKKFANGRPSRGFNKKNNLTPYKRSKVIGFRQTTHIFSQVRRRAFPWLRPLVRRRFQAPPDRRPRCRGSAY